MNAERHVWNYPPGPTKIDLLYGTRCRGDVGLAARLGVPR